MTWFPRKVSAVHIVIYSKPNCQQCRMTRFSFDRAGVEYSTVDLTISETALEYVQDLGYSQAPVVVVNDHHHWSGFNPLEIERLVQSLQTDSGKQPARRSVP
jgi:glutaredoxin-like protein NrdH